MGIKLEPDTKETRKLLNDLARHQILAKLFSDIRMDMEICEIEGWNKMEFIFIIYKELDNFVKHCGQASDRSDTDG